MTLPTPLSLMSLMASPGNGITGQLFMFAMIIAIFYFILFAPQQKQRKQHEEALRNLKKGDEVVTAGGVIGEVLHIAVKDASAKDKEGNPVRTMEDRVTIKSAESRMIVERGRISRIAGKSGSETSAA
ncbi:MAG: preprotein translocase subunit YajC [Gemmatimonadota bacterium]|nr:preprotein translocase subunit YajC [Gemmatimonadota bacterium]